MWTRRELKNKAKGSMKANYWKTVLAALVTLAISGAIGSSAGSSAASNASDYGQNEEITQTYTQEDLDELLGETSVVEETESADELPSMIVDMLEQGQVDEADGAALESVAPILLVALGVFVLVSIVIAVVFAAFVINPLGVGASRFFLCNLNSAAEAKEIAWAYDHNYRETVKTMFWRDVYTLLWTLLLVVPGIIKAYEYRMIPYLLADDPTMTKARAFAESKRLMKGNKWRAFVLDLSFLGWLLLSLLTLGALSVFYVQPYKCMTDAALYERLRYGTTIPEDRMLSAGSKAPAHAAGNAPVPPSTTADVLQPAWDEYEPTE